MTSNVSNLPLMERLQTAIDICAFANCLISPVDQSILHGIADRIALSKPLTFLDELLVLGALHVIDEIESRKNEEIESRKNETVPEYVLHGQPNRYAFT